MGKIYVMNLRESEIEDIIYESPWLLDERYLVSVIKGARNQNGRQINVGFRSNRYIDLLFKDSRDNRPVIIELKKEPLKRENIGQILEYRGLVISLNEEDRKIWKAEFGENYYAPKMVLIGASASEDIIIAANLAGIEVKIFGSPESSFHIDPIDEIKYKLKEWEALRSLGLRNLSQRIEWVNEVISDINKAIEIIGDENLEIQVYPAEIYDKELNYCPQFSPFLNTYVPYAGVKLVGFYEYADYDALIPFSEEYLYCDILFYNEIQVGSEGNEADSKLANLLYLYEVELSAIGLEFIKYGDYLTPLIKIKRKEFSVNRSKILVILIRIGIEIYHKYFGRTEV